MRWLATDGAGEWRIIVSPAAQNGVPTSVAVLTRDVPIGQDPRPGLQLAKCDTSAGTYGGSSHGETRLGLCWWPGRQ